MGQQAARIMAALRKAVERECTTIVLDIDRELRKLTPVLTGHARANWVPSVGSPYTGTAGSAEHDSGVAQVLAYKLEDGPLWIANNVPYIQRLNMGSSRKAPAGFIEMAIDTALARAEQRKLQHVDVTALRAAHRDQVGGSAAGNLASAYSPFGDDA